MRIFGDAIEKQIHVSLQEGKERCPLLAILRRIFRKKSHRYSSHCELHGGLIVGPAVLFPSLLAKGPVSRLIGSEVPTASSSVEITVFDMRHLRRSPDVVRLNTDRFTTTFHPKQNGVLKSTECWMLLQDKCPRKEDGSNGACDQVATSWRCLRMTNGMIWPQHIRKTASFSEVG